MIEGDRVAANPLRRHDLALPAPSTEPLALHRRLPGYEVTPLRSVPGLATELGVGHVLVKDEAWRLGLPAFKMLGASWATYRALRERLGADPEPWRDLDELADRLDPLRPLTLATATDGNHGRALARMARLLRFAARIWVPANTVRSRIEAIEGEGAEVIVATGGYDDAVREAAAAADDRTLVVSDTSWEGYTTIPSWVIDGYSTIFLEVDQQIEEQGLPPVDVVLVPMGVGAFAAAAVAHHRQEGARPATLVGVEPVDAACVMESCLAGRLITLEGEQRSIMAGLNCGTPSPIAWPLTSAGLDWLVAVDDDEARAAMRRLAEAGILAGESGAASLAGARRLAREGVALEPGATVLLLSTEGATDPEAYTEIVGRAPDAVVA